METSVSANVFPNGILTKAVKEVGVPGISSKMGKSNSDPLAGYSLKYFKADIDDETAKWELTRIMTEGLRGDRVVILKEDKHTFLAQYFVVIQYLEKDA